MTLTSKLSCSTLKKKHLHSSGIGINPKNLIRINSASPTLKCNVLLTDVLLQNTFNPSHDKHLLYHDARFHKPGHTMAENLVKIEDSLKSEEWTR